MRGVYRLFFGVEAHLRGMAIADEDMDGESDGKTSAVHFVRLELDPARRAAVKAGDSVRPGFDHTHNVAHTTISAETRASLAGDLG